VQEDGNELNLTSRTNTIESARLEDEDSNLSSHRNSVTEQQDLSFTITPKTKVLDSKVITSQ
jgi:hypothetical protein